MQRVPTQDATRDTEFTMARVMRGMTWYITASMTTRHTCCANIARHNHKEPAKMSMQGAL